MPINYKLYPKNWKSEIRPAILERDNNCCKFCKVSNGIYIFRGTLYGKEVFQNANGEIFSYPDGQLLDTDVYAPIEPLNGDINSKAFKVVLTIMHLDHDTTNNEYTNLAAGCQKCHLNYDKNHHRKNSRNTINKKKLLQNLF
jgi:hypothetical protein